MAFILLGITLFIMRTLDRSKFGRAMFYINKDEIAAQSMGISVRYYKLYAFVIGAGIAGAAGSMFSVQYSAVSPEAFDVTQSIMFFTIVLVGGSASLPGVLIGTFVMFVLPEMFREFETARYLVFGVAMILTMISMTNLLMMILLMMMRFSLNHQKMTEIMFLSTSQILMMIHP